MTIPIRSRRLAVGAGGAEHPGRTRRVRGITLLELMIVLVIVAVLAGIALPSYRDYVLRGHVVEATSGLSDMRTRLEQYFLDNRTYPGNCIAPASGPAGTGNLYLPSAAAYFTFACSNLTATTYTVTATGVAAQGMSGFVYTIDQTNTRATTSTGPWGKNSTTCWVSRMDGSC